MSRELTAPTFLIRSIRKTRTPQKGDSVMSGSISTIERTGIGAVLQSLRERHTPFFSVPERIRRNVNIMDRLSQTSVSSIEQQIRSGKDLSFHDAFCGACYIVASTNSFFEAHCREALKQASGVSDQTGIQAEAVRFSRIMSRKERSFRLTAEEIAGMVAAIMMDTLIELPFSRIIDTCGTGGDRGKTTGGTVLKGVNASTLAAVTIAATRPPDLYVAKHGTAGRSSALGSSDTLEQFGAHTTGATVDDLIRYAHTSFCYTDAREMKTAHDLITVLGGSLLDHVYGPLTPPIGSATEVNKVMGTNHFLHPETLARAYQVLHERNIQRIGGVAVIAGLETTASRFADPRDDTYVRSRTVLDEPSPFSNVVSIARPGELNTFFLAPDDIDVHMDPGSIGVFQGSSELHRANADVISGTESSRLTQVAFNAALGMLAAEYVPSAPSLAKKDLLAQLRTCYKQCHDALTSGKARNTLIHYVTQTGGVFRA